MQEIFKNNSNSTMPATNKSNINTSSAYSLLLRLMVMHWTAPGSVVFYIDAGGSIHCNKKTQRMTRRRCSHVHFKLAQF